MENLNELFVHTLKDVYFAEKRILQALPKMAKKVSAPQLQQAFTKHAEETKVHIQRLEEVFKMLDMKPRGVTCHAILGLIEEGEHIMEEAGDQTVLDAGILAAAQAVEHYEISRYGTLVTWAQTLGMPQAAKTLKQTLDEEYKTDELLTKVATGNVNKMAA